MENIEQHTIGNIPIRIVEKHHHVLLAWAELRETKPYVLSFDHHTDTLEAFRRYANDNKLDRNQLAKDINPSDQQNLIDTIAKLKNDEHIDAAIKADIINKALIISYASGKHEEGRVYCLRENEQYNNERIIINSPTCLFDCSKTTHDDNCTPKRHNSVIESKYLANTIEIFNDVIPKNEWEQNYILDIDLDCFHTMKSISPNDIEYFRNLIRNAKMITIAKESQFVNDWKKNDPNISSEKLLNNLLEIIQESTTMENSTDKKWNTKLKNNVKFFTENLSVIILIPTLLGGVWQLMELSNLSLSYIRFFSLSQLIADGLLVLFICLWIYFSLKVSSFLFKNFKEEKNRKTVIFKFVMTTISCMMFWWMFYVESTKSNAIVFPLLLSCICFTTFLIDSALYFFVGKFILKILESKIVNEYLYPFFVIGFIFGAMYVVPLILHVFRKEYLFPLKLSNWKNVECFIDKRHPQKTSFEIVYFNDKYFFAEVKKTNEMSFIEIIEFNELFKDNCNIDSAK